MHWEKIPLQIRRRYKDGRYEEIDVLKEQLEDLNKLDIPVRLVRQRQLNGKEILYWEKQVEG